MKVFDQLGLARLTPAASASDGEERIRELFRSRSELKKAYSELQDEVHQLRDRLKQQEGATLRVQDMLERLETRIADPDRAWTAIVFFRLRKLWNTGNTMLSQFAAELEKQQVDREHRAYLVDFNRRAFAERQAAEQALQRAELTTQTAHDELQSAQRQLSRLDKPWHHFRKRDLAAQLEVSRMASQQAQAEYEQARERLGALLAAGETAFSGLSVEARRAVNVAVIAFAEVLCMRLAKTALLAQAKAAAARREAGDEYGARAECELLLIEIARGLAALEQRANLPQDVKLRTEKLVPIVRYASEDDTLPSPESLDVSDGDVLQQRSQGAAPARFPNVLLDDTWDILKVLMH